MMRLFFKGYCEGIGFGLGLITVASLVGVYAHLVGWVN